MRRSKVGTGRGVGKEIFNVQWFEIDSSCNRDTINLLLMRGQKTSIRTYCYLRCPLGSVCKWRLTPVERRVVFVPIPGFDLARPLVEAAGFRELR